MDTNSGIGIDAVGPKAQAQRQRLGSDTGSRGEQDRDFCDTVVCSTSQQ